ncbi:virulence-associated protein E [Sphingobacterium alimentarium]|uniref:Virulence-associated protein E n=1 Tax=Sphingobacterium alimentarium TaxID=797292 RepID=A0A4V2VTA8_9SPHI|nr:VapE domain-containing protein [Sphingobacterium alimentarium]TCV05651.1 virulence-associated protein E [Sphingobacterium alimentarium]
MTKRDDASSIQKVVEYLVEQYDFRRNILTNTVEFKLKTDSNYQEVNENNLYLNLRIEVGIKASISDILVFLGSDYVEDYDPLNEYFISIKSRYNPNVHGDYIEKFCSYIKTQDQERFNLQLKKWLVRTVLCALKNDYFNKQTFVFQSEIQNMGKTSLCRFIVPKPLTSYYIENIGLDKDSTIALSSNFICILDELASLTKFEINALKAIMSKLYINVRHPYERKAKSSPRRISFIGSTNQTEFLTDDSNVRWLCFRIQEINWDYKKDVDIDIVWSHAYYLLQSGFKYEMTREEIHQNEIANDSFKVSSVEFEVLQKYLSPGTVDNYHRELLSSEIMHELQMKTYPKLNAKELHKALKRLGFQSHQRRGYIDVAGEKKEHPVKVYYVLDNLLTT